jgi:hypothetical protein
MRLAIFLKLSKRKQEEEVERVLKSLAKTQKKLEKNGTFTSHNPKKEGGLVMEYKLK